MYGIDMFTKIQGHFRVKVISRAKSILSQIVSVWISIMERTMGLQLKRILVYADSFGFNLSNNIGNVQSG